jgi:hypothetical protein
VKAPVVAQFIIPLAVLSACSHAPNPTPQMPIAESAQGAIFTRAATFWSKATGSVLLNDISGDTHPCRAKKLSIGLVKSSDLDKFVRLLKAHQTLDLAKIDDPSGGHMLYKLRGVRVTGKATGRIRSSPEVTLEFSSLELTGCGSHNSVQTSVPKALLPTLP